MVLPLVSGRNRFRVAVAADTALISTEAIFCAGRILGRYHHILMAGGRIIGIFGFGGRAGLAATDIIAVLGASVRYGFPKRPIVYMLCRLVIVQLRQNLCLGGVAARADPECRAGGADCGFLGGDPFAKGMTQGGNLGIRIGIAAELTGMRGVASGAARGLYDLGRIIVGLLRCVIVYIGVLTDGTGMGGVTPGGTGGSGYSIFIGVCQTVNAFRVAAAAGTGVGFDASCCAGGFSGNLKGILMGMSFYELVQFLLLRCAANCAENAVAISVSNPTQYRRKESVEAKIKLNVNTPFVKVIDKQKQEVPSQIVKKTGKNFEIIFFADVPSYAVHIYAVVPSDEECKIKNDLEVSEHRLENSKYKVIFNKNGDLAYLFDKELNKQLIKAPIKLALLHDTGSLAYPSWELRKEDIDKQPYCYANTPTFETVENGPARIAIKITREAEYSTIIQTVSLYPDSKVIRVDNEIEWRTRRTLLKAVFPLSASNYTAKYDSGVGYTERENNNEKLYEVPAQKWADITDTSGEFGVSILTDCKHGWDKPDNNTLRLTCIHSPLGAFTKETRQDLQDLGRNCFSFGIYGHKGDIENGTNKESMNFARKLITCEVKKSESKGEFSQIASLLKITHDNIVIRAVKMSEDDENALIVRLNNATAIEQKNAALSVYREFEKVDEVNTSEEFIRNHAEVNGKVIRVTLKPFETITLKIKFAKSEECENNNTYSPMRLNYNVKAFTNYDNMKHIILQGGGYSLPIDLIGRNIKVNGIEFYIPHGNRKNKKPKCDAVACRGQSINLDGKYNQIYILAGAVSEEDIVGTFKIDRKDYNINFKSMTAPYSKWDMYGLGQTAHTDDETAFGYEFTHLHHPEGNLVKKARMYLYSLNVKNKKRLRFPNNNKLVIFAMTSAEKEEFTNLADNVIDIVDDNYDFGKIPPIDKITDKTDAITIRAGKIQDQYNGGKGKGFLRDNLITNIIRSYTKSEW